MAEEIKTVVVIGDGPSPEGMCWGDKIDAQDRIVRLYNHEWQRTKDYGTHYHHGVITSIKDPWRAWRRPTLSWFYFKSSGASDGDVREINDVAVVRLDHDKWHARALAMGGKAREKSLKLTRGFAAAAGAIETLRPKLLYLIGMDMLRTGATMSPRYAMAASAWRDQVYPGVPQEAQPAGSRHEGPHDYEVESALLASLAVEARAEIAWGF